MLEKLKIVLDAQNYLYNACDIQFNNFEAEKEGLEYYAHSYIINSKNIKFRIAKKTPTKTGWFVSIWKRGSDGIIAPYDESDAIDFVIIAIVNNDKIGQFMFPKSVLLNKNIFSENNKGGKRAMRLYTPDDHATSTQAIETQKWQDQYFIDLTSQNSKYISLIKNILN